jgi:hypothetical protein
VVIFSFFFFINIFYINRLLLHNYYEESILEIHVIFQNLIH